MLQEVERQQRSQLMASMRSLPVHMKSTFSSQIQATVVREVGLEHPIRKAEPRKRYSIYTFTVPYLAILQQCKASTNMIVFVSKACLA